ncbi:hypothetical protein B0H11DRAFT_2289211, partial [Mycena galericulata]
LLADAGFFLERGAADAKTRAPVLRRIAAACLVIWSQQVDGKTRTRSPLPRRYFPHHCHPFEDAPVALAFLVPDTTLGCTYCFWDRHHAHHARLYHHLLGLVAGGVVVVIVDCGEFAGDAALNSSLSSSPPRLCTRPPAPTSSSLLTNLVIPSPHILVTGAWVRVVSVVRIA